MEILTEELQEITTTTVVEIPIWNLFQDLRNSMFGWIAKDIILVFVLHQAYNVLSHG